MKVQLWFQKSVTVRGELLTVSLYHGDNGGLTLGLVEFDLVCFSPCQILLGQVKIGQRWHAYLMGKLEELPN